MPTHTTLRLESRDDFASYVPVDRSRCRFCGGALRQSFVDLGMSPLCESFVSADQLNEMEAFYPLHVFVCDRCYLVQLQEYVSGEAIFTEYAYFSSYSTTFLEHCRRYCEQMVERFGLGAHSQVVEVASNDGYALQYFVQRGIPALGIEPAANVARAALEKGVPTRVQFFTRAAARQLVAEGLRADLLYGKNVLAQVHDINDFVGGFKILLAPTGVATIEFPHLERLVADNLFDTIYHEHFSYFSLHSARTIFAAHGLTVFDVEEVATHGGSLRLYLRHDEHEAWPVSQRITAQLQRERELGMLGPEYYRSFAQRVKETKWKLLELLMGVRREGKVAVGYGAPGKGNTLLNYCGIRTDLLDYTVDRNPYKHGKYLPGTHIPIYAPDQIERTRPDYVLILPWNLKDEIMAQLAFIREWGGRFIVPIPEPRVYE